MVALKSNTIRRFYNQPESAVYERLQKESGWEIPTKIVLNVLARSVLIGGERVADIGCGPGMIGDVLASTRWGGTLVGVDFAENRLREASRKKNIQNALLL